MDSVSQHSTQIRDHYNEEPNFYADAIRDIIETREAARTPTRDGNGINLIFRYYNLLYYVERRFFPYGKRLIVLRQINRKFYFDRYNFGFSEKKD